MNPRVLISSYTLAPYALKPCSGSWLQSSHQYIIYPRDSRHMIDIPRAFICLDGASGDQHSVHLIVVANDVKPLNSAENRSESIHMIPEPS